MIAGGREQIVKLYVGNLPYQASEQDLEDIFAGAGFAVDQVQIIRDRMSGESRGFGFVEIEDDQAGTQAVAACNGKDCLGRNLVVNEARPREERRPDHGRSGGGGGRGRGRF